jgi:hypothetical protein
VHVRTCTITPTGQSICDFIQIYFVKKGTVSTLESEYVHHDFDAIDGWMHGIRRIAWCMPQPQPTPLAVLNGCQIYSAAATRTR